MSQTLELLLSYQTSLRAVATVLGAGAAAAGLAFTVPSLVDRLRPPARQETLADFLPFIEMLPNRKHIKCVADRYVSIVEIGGAELNLSSFETRAELFLARKYMLDEAQRSSFAEIRLFTTKERLPINTSPNRTNPLLQAISEQWNKDFSHAYSLRHFALLVVKASHDQEASELLKQSEDFILRTLSSFDCRVLEEGPDPTTGPAAVLARLISPVSRPAPKVAGLEERAMNRMIAVDSIDFGADDSGILRFSNGRDEKLATILGVRDCGEKTSENAYREIIGIDAELVIHHAIQPLNTSLQMAKLKQEQMAAPMMTLSQNASYEIMEAISLLDGQSEMKATLHNYAMNVVVYGETPEDLGEIENEIVSIISRTGATCVRELITAQAVWFSMFSFDRLWPRQFRFMSQNVATNLVLHKPNIGLRKSDWCNEPLSYFRSVTGEAYAFQFHATEDKEAVPHCVSIGPTGTGKTTLVSFLAAQALRLPDLRVYLFDRLNGCEVFVRCAGGDYVTFDGDASSAKMNPLLLDDTPDNRQFQQRWLRLLGDAKDAFDEEEITRALDINYAPYLDASFRKLESLHKAAFSPHGNLRKSLQPWVDANMLGGYFNADEDNLDLTKARLAGFDMTKILGDHRLAPPIVDYIIHRIRSNATTTGSPSLVFVDETEPMLQNELFRNNFVKVGLQEARKLRQAYILAFQRPEAIKATGMSELIRGQCQTVFFYRNRNAKPEDYDDWGLNESELAFVLGKDFAGPEHKYAVLVKKYSTGQSAILDINLSVLGRYLKVFSSGRPAVIELTKAIEKYGKDAFLEPYLNGEFAAR
ncbi:hypothetical protein [Microvirga calopogonii]|uniref:VirB4 family type IV secretion/conjugal transfer ATPase n=1 Tax=Microvirga calopogonii TaxID=2078013 RepID=UPI000E0D8E2C|nr:hypothetical protein [Microvirga calopogonii]